MSVFSFTVQQTPETSVMVRLAIALWDCLARYCGQLVARLGLKGPKALTPMTVLGSPVGSEVPGIRDEVTGMMEVFLYGHSPPWRHVWWHR